MAEQRVAASQQAEDFALEELDVEDEFGGGDFGGGDS